jgi:TetR/AcrR family transcriptional repressor of nem operon
MRVSNEEKEKSRARILAAAGRLFRERGVEGASVSDIMREAEMTHGGFYRHFADKEALLAAALTEAFANFALPLLAASETAAATAADTFRARYLSETHRAHPGQGCPAAALGPDIARTDPAVRAAFSEGVDRVVAGLARANGAGAAARSAALRDLATMVGAIVLARASNDDLAAEILDACATREV